MKKKLLLLLICPILLLGGCNERPTLKHYHYYNPESQQWSWEYDESGYPSKASVTVKCDNSNDDVCACDQMYKTIEATITPKFVEEPNCCESGILRYIANANFEDTVYTQSKDYALDKTNHLFDKFDIEKEGHAKVCAYCGLLEDALSPHEYGASGEAYFKCSVCGYVDAERKEEYSCILLIEETNELISEIMQKTDIMPYHESLIRDVDTKYELIPDEYKEEILNYNYFLTFKRDYQKKYEIIFGDNSRMYGHNNDTGNDETEVTVKKSQPSLYGYGFAVSVNEVSLKNILKYDVSTPTYSTEDEYEGVFYTHNVPSSFAVRFVSENNDVMIENTDNTDLGDGWIERKVNRDYMANLIKYQYNSIYIPLDNDTIKAGEYFISDLYAIKPEVPTSGKHFVAKENSSINPGNKEFWQYDGLQKVYFTNPDPSFSWEESSCDVLPSSHSAYLAPFGTINVDTTNQTLWKETVYDQVKSEEADGKRYNQLKVGVNPAGETGPYINFSNFVWSDWTPNLVGVDGTYSLNNFEEMKFVNTISLTYYSYNPSVPIDVKIKVVDQNGDAVIAFEDQIGHCNSPITQSYRFEAHNFDQLIIETKAFAAGASGRSELLIKDLSFFYTVPGEPVGCHYPAKEASNTNSGNKEYWTLYEDPSTIHLTNPDPANDWDEGDSPILTDDNPAFLGKFGSHNVDLCTDTNWTTVSSFSQIKMEYDLSVSGKTKCASFKNYQYFDWSEDKLGLVCVYTNPDEVIQTNSISFAYFVQRDNGDIEKANLNVDISIIDNTGNERHIDSFVIGKSVEGWQTYNKVFVETNFYQLKIVTTSEFKSTLPKDKGINTIMFANNMVVEHVDNASTYIFDTTNPSLWEKSSIQETNKIVVGTNPSWPATEGSGDYLALRNYQWTDWSASDVIVSATYTLPKPVTINNLDFKYRLSSAADNFDADKMTITIISFDDNNVEHLIDSFVIEKDGALFGIDNPYHKDFDSNIKISKLSFILSSYVDDSEFKGSSCFFVKDIIGSLLFK